MLKTHAMFDEYSYKVANLDLDSTVTALDEGQWVTINDAGNLVIADGTKKAFMAIGSVRKGRDQVAGVAARRVTFLIGHAIKTTDQVDSTGVYAPMTPLKLKEGGIVTPATLTGASADTMDKVVGYSLGKISTDGFLKIMILP